jgi:hypothetical protein
MMKIKQWREEIKQKYRREGLTEEQIEERFNTEWFERLEARQKWRREGRTEEQIDKLVQKLKDNPTQWRNYLKNSLKNVDQDKPVNRRTWPPWYTPFPKENVRVKLKPCLKCGLSPHLLKSGGLTMNLYMQIID